MLKFSTKKLILCRIFLHIFWYVFTLSHPQLNQESFFETYCFTSLNWITMRSTSIVQKVVVVSRATAFRWFVNFPDNNTELNDLQITCRLHDIDRETVIDSIDLDPTLTSSDLADGFDYDHITIWRILKAFSKKRRKRLWVPHSLTETQKRNESELRVFIWIFVRVVNFFNNIVTVDEKWVFASHLTASCFIPLKTCSERFCRLITQSLFGTVPIYSSIYSPGNILL